MKRSQTLITLAQARGWEIIAYHFDGSGAVGIGGNVILEFDEHDDDWTCKMVFSLPGSPNDVKEFWPQMKEELMAAVNLVLGCGAEGNA